MAARAPGPGRAGLRHTEEIPPAAGGRDARFRDLARTGAGAPERKGSRRVPSPEAAPEAAHEALDRLQLVLVRHLRALPNPVAEAQGGQAQLAAGIDLPHHVVGAETRAAPGGLIEGIERGQ